MRAARKGGTHFILAEPILPPADLRQFTPCSTDGRSDPLWPAVVSFLTLKEVST
jgi:hypothetical protein